MTASWRRYDVVMTRISNLKRTPRSRLCVEHSTFSKWRWAPKSCVHAENCRMCICITERCMFISEMKLLLSHSAHKKCWTCIRKKAREMPIYRWAMRQMTCNDYRQREAHRTMNLIYTRRKIMFSKHVPESAGEPTTACDDSWSIPASGPSQEKWYCAEGRRTSRFGHTRSSNEQRALHNILRSKYRQTAQCSRLVRDQTTTKQLSKIVANDLWYKLENAAKFSEGELRRCTNVWVRKFKMLGNAEMCGSKKETQERNDHGKPVTCWCANRSSEENWLKPAFTK